VTSFDELHATSICSDEFNEYIAFNNRQLSRIYPKGSRVDSSNYDPVPFWAGGCQVVALNYQTASDPMFVNEGMFSQNAGCGYVLKPKAMLDGGAKWARHMEKVYLYTVKIIDGWRPVSKRSLTLQIAQALPSLTVTVSVYSPAGVVTNTTAVVKNNGLNPIWDEEFTFEVSAPDVSCILFVVNNKNASDPFVGYYSVALGASRLGYRRIPLKDAKGGPLPDASLFVHLAKKLKPDPIRKIRALEKQVKALTHTNVELLKRLDAMEKRMNVLDGKKKD